MLRSIFLPFALLLSASLVYGAVLGQVQGIVHDPSHRPIAGASIVLRAAHSDLFAVFPSHRTGSVNLFGRHSEQEKTRKVSRALQPQATLNGQGMNRVRQGRRRD